MKKLRRLRCKLLHTGKHDITIPVNGKYYCLKCLEQFDAWVKEGVVETPKFQAVKKAAVGV